MKHIYLHVKCAKHTLKKTWKEVISLRAIYRNHKHKCIHTDKRICMVYKMTKDSEVMQVIYTPLSTQNVPVYN